jgi:hypothetical protein
VQHGNKSSHITTLDEADQTYDTCSPETDEELPDPGLFPSLVSLFGLQQGIVTACDNFREDVIFTVDQSKHAARPGSSSVKKYCKYRTKMLQ